MKPPRRSWLAVAVVLGVSAALIGAALALHTWKDVPLADLTRDPVTTFQVAPYVGLLSQIGILLWAAAAAVCLFGASVLRRRAEGAEERRFLLASGLATLVLGLDDAFLFHEEFVPRLGMPQGLVFIVYAVLFALYVWRFAPVILKTEYALLVMALVFFGVSLAVDVAHPEVLGQYELLVEDGAKLVGILSWLVYFVRTAATVIERCDSRGEGASRAATGRPGRTPPA